MAARRRAVNLIRRLPTTQFLSSKNGVRTLETLQRNYSTPVSPAVLKLTQESHSSQTTEEQGQLYHINHGVRRFSTAAFLNQSEAETAEETQEDEGNFDTYGISEVTQNALRANGIEKLFPVQIKGYQYIREGRDVVVKARTGTGKTLAFALPLVEKLLDRPKQRGDKPKAIVLTPTRELAMQVMDHTQRLNNRIRVTCVYGGSPYRPQENAIYNGLDIVVGTPGRVLDMIEKGVLQLTDIDHVILDEVDRMLDMGFQEIVDKILASCYERTKPQTLMFSATVPSFVKQAARKYLSEDVLLIDLIGKQNVQSATTVTQMAVKCEQVTQEVLQSLIATHCSPGGKTIVFCETKRQCDNISQFLKRGSALHGDVSQMQRNRVLQNFKSDKLNVLVTTDVAARGLDIPNVDLVIQCSPPNDIDNFIHRTGRTGRAGQMGKAIMIYHPNDYFKVRQCEKVANTKILALEVAHPDRRVIIDGVISKLEKVHMGDALELCSDKARQLIDTKGAEESLSIALVLLADLNGQLNKSLLTHRWHYRTFQLKPLDGNASLETVRGLIEGIIYGDSVKGLTTNTNGDTFYFDVDKQHCELLTKSVAAEMPNFELVKLCAKLPDDVELQSTNDQNNEKEHYTSGRSSRSRYDGERSDYGSGYQRSYNRDFQNRNSFSKFGEDGNSYGSRGFQSRGSGYGNRNSYRQNSDRRNTRRQNSFDDEEYL